MTLAEADSIFISPARASMLARTISDKKNLRIRLDGLEGSAAAMLMASLPLSGPALVVADDADAIREAVERALARYPLVITTGGLGPTKDDITKHTLMGVFGGELVFDSSVLENVEEIFAKRGLKINELTRTQAMVPTSCRVIQNRYGTAPVMWFETADREHVLVSMPGVPFETAGMLRHGVTDEIARRFHPDITILHTTFLITGITESALAERLAEVESALDPTLHLAYLPTPGLIRLRVDGKDSDAGRIARLHAEACEAVEHTVGELIISRHDATPEQLLLDALRSRGLKLATAESCTGGNIAHRITLIAGASDVFNGSVVSYANEVKTGVLGVDPADIEQYGAVSESVVRQMAEGAAARLGADCAVATSGIAGPGGGSADKPVGTVWIAAHTPKGTVARLLHCPGNRARVIDRASTEALLLLLKSLQNV